MVKMELPASQSQSASTQSATVELVEAIQGLISAVGKVDGISSFKGVAASKAKEYGQSYIVPAATAAETLVKGVVQDVAKLTQKYMSDVDGKSHDSEKLKEQMEQLSMAQAALNSAMDTAKSIPDKGVSGTIVSALQGKMSANDAKAKKYKKLYDDFMKYDGTSSDIFSDLDGLESAFNTGISEILKGFNKGAGTYGEFDTSQSRAWTVAASNDEQEIKSERKLDMSRDGKSFGDYLFTGENAADVTNDIGKDVSKESGKKGARDIDFDNLMAENGDYRPRSERIKAKNEIKVGQFEGAFTIAGDALSAYSFASGTVDDMGEGKTAGQAVAHNGGGIIAGEAGALLGTGLIALAPVDVPVLLGFTVVAGAGVLASSIYNYEYDHNKLFHSFMNGIGNFLDKEVINPRNEVYKEQGQSVMKYTPYPY